MDRLNEINKQMEELAREKARIQEEERKEKFKIEQERKKKLETEKESRWNEIESRNKELQELYKNYLKDYGSIKYSAYDNELSSLLNLFGI